jgi:PEP-CTERM motif
VLSALKGNSYVLMDNLTMNNFTKRLTLALAVLWLGIGRVESTQAGSGVYVVAHDYGSSNGPDLFGQVDVATGSFNQISDLSTPGFTIFGMGFGTNGQLYGVGFNFADFTAPGELFGINPSTGAATDLGPITFTPAGASGSTNGSLYALDFSASNPASLYSINPLSNSSNLIGTVPFTSDGLVAVDSKGNLFAAGNGDGSFFKVSTTDASTTLIGNTGLGLSLYAGNFVGSTLYGFAAVGANETIVTIDTSNASITTGPNVALPANYAIVAAASVPEPSSLILVGSGVLSALACGFLRRKTYRPTQSPATGAVATACE